MKLLIHPAIEPERLEKLRRAEPALELVNATTHEEAARHMADADAFFGKITPPLLKMARQLRWVQAATVSLEHYIFPELVEHPCVLTNMRGLFSDVIADQVLGYVICFARNLHIYIRNQMTAKWAPEGGENERVSFAAGPGVVNAIDRAHRPLAGSVMGIVGLGAIGSEIARRALAFGMRVIAVDPQPRDTPVGVEAVWPGERLPDLLAASDWVVVAAPHTPDTAGSFRLPQFSLMRPSAFFINIGRGAIVVLDDLVQALELKRIAGAALDVFEVEPLPANHALWKFPNVILTPHVAGYSPLIAERHLGVLLDNLGRFMQGEPLRNVARKDLWY